MTGTRIDQTTRRFAFENVVEAGLVTGDAGIDFVRAILSRFIHKFRIRQKRTRHADHIGAALGEYLLADLRTVDAVNSDKRNVDFAHQPLGNPGKTRTRHHGRYRRHARLMPADAGIDEGRPRFFNFLCELYDFFPSAAFIDQVEHGKTVDDDKIFADGFSCLSNNF